MESFKGTTILVVRRNNEVAIGGDGQVTLGHTIVKGSARKIRRLGKGEILAGFAGSTADAITLIDKFEGKLEKFSKNLGRAAVELAKDWRTDKILRKLEAMLLVADKNNTYLISGLGDVIEPDEEFCSIGSGSMAALASAKALYSSTDLSAEEIVKKSLVIASEICIYTNDNISIEKIGE